MLDNTSPMHQFLSLCGALTHGAVVVFSAEVNAASAPIYVRPAVRVRSRLHSCATSVSSHEACLAATHATLHHFMCPLFNRFAMIVADLRLFSSVNLKSDPKYFDVVPSDSTAPRLFCPSDPPHQVSATLLCSLCFFSGISLSCISRNLPSNFLRPLIQ